MNNALRSLIISLFIVCTATPAYAAGQSVELTKETPNVIYRAGINFKPEVFAAFHYNEFNKFSSLDEVVFARQTFDAYGDIQYEFLEVKGALRNQVTWGNATAKTGDSEVKVFGANAGNHRHEVGRLYPWFKELWLKFDLGRALGITLTHKHEITLGEFPFQLGRGISLGDAYAVGPGVLGFFTDDIVNNYAYGARLSGMLVDRKNLSYDVYVALLRNRCTSYAENKEKIYRQEIGKRHSPERGFGSVNFIAATRLYGTAFNNECWGKATVEPYLLYHGDPEQKVEFTGDASTKMGTFGVACEYAYKALECGLDTAFNFGNQYVRGWDRNTIQIKNINSYGRTINSQITYVEDSTTGATGKMPFVEGSVAQVIIDSATQSCDQNGKAIGTVNTVQADGSIITEIGGVTTPFTLYNGKYRFRPAYVNKLRGSMIVADAAYWAIEKELMVAITGGFASGDENPNYKPEDKTYDGFIGLQEIYSGKRVRSAFVLGGAGRMRRLTSAPLNPGEAQTKFGTNVSGFTNLIFTGAALSWKPQRKERAFNLNPNILFYWQDHPSKKFDLATNRDSTECASPFLGTELNLFSYINIIKNLKGYLVTSLFIPGKHFTHIRGKPMNQDQQEAIENFNAESHTAIPNISHDPAFTFNLGVEYNF